MDKITSIDIFFLYLPGFIMFVIGIALDLGLIYLWCKWIDKVYTIKNSKNLYKIIR